jgi:hypothetical protein
MPLVALPRAAFDRLRTGQAATVDGIKGEIVIESSIKLNHRQKPVDISKFISY